MKRTEKDLQKYYEECRQIMIGLGYNATKVPISLNGRLSRTLGRYFRVEEKIEINKDYFLYAEESAVKNTIIHEICHQVCKESGHGTEWKRIAEHVSYKTPYKITRLASTEKTNYISPKKNRPKKYIVKCTKCNHEWKYSTKTKAYKNPHAYFCTFCNVKKTLTSLELK